MNVELSEDDKVIVTPENYKEKCDEYGWTEEQQKINKLLRPIPKHITFEV